VKDPDLLRGLDVSNAGEGALEDGANGVFDPSLRTVAARGE
jgi:hypothetical protein